MSIEEQIKQLEETKNKEIESLTKMKDMLKQKLQEASKENAELKKKLDELQTELNNVAKAEPKLQLQAQLGKSLEEKKINIEQVQAEAKGLPPRPPTPNNQCDVDLSLIDKKIGAIQAKLDKSLDIIFEQLGTIIATQKVQSNLQNLGQPNIQVSQMPQNDEFKNNPIVNKFANQIMKQNTQESSENNEESEAPINLMKPSTFSKKLDQMAQSQQTHPQFQPQQPQFQPQQPQFQPQQPQFQPQQPQFQPQQPQFQQPLQQQFKQNLTQEEMRPKKPSEVGTQPSVNTPETSGGVMFFDYPSSGVITCPFCGKQSFQEMENRNQILSYVPKIKYGKKYYCKACRKEWAYKM